MITRATRRGFCPACGLFEKNEAPRELRPAVVASLASVLVAASAWAFTITQSQSMIGMSLGPWLVMMVAVMLPSAVPFVFTFAGHSERRHGWPLATLLLCATYLAIWLVFGGAGYAAYRALGMPWHDQAAIGGIALLLAGVYTLSPLNRASAARCRELCALHGSLPFNLYRSAVVAAARYGLSCMGCTAGLMVAMVVMGMSNVAWMAVLAMMVFAYKLVPITSTWRSAGFTAALAVLGVIYALT